MIISSLALEWVSAIGAISVPVALAALTWVFNLSRNFAVEQERSAEAKRQHDALSRESKERNERLMADGKQRDIRLTIIEQATQNHKDSLVRLEAQFGTINSKLEAMPRIEALLNNFAYIAQTIVPRSELEARFKSLEDRIAD